MFSSWKHLSSYSLWFCFSLLLLGVVGSSICFRLCSIFYGAYSFFYEFFAFTNAYSKTMILFLKLFLDSFSLLYLSLLKASRLGHWFALGLYLLNLIWLLRLFLDLPTALLSKHSKTIINRSQLLLMYTWVHRLSGVVILVFPVWYCKVIHMMPS